MPSIRRIRTAAVAGIVVMPLLIGPGCTSLQTQTKVLRISATEAQTLIENHLNDADFVILDVRNPDEFASGHIAGAVNVCFRCDTFLNELAGLDKSKIYLVYCASSNRSGQAAAEMDAQGFLHLYDMAGGINQWKADGLPVVQ